MTYLRERMGKIVAFGIGFSLLAFVGEEAIRSGNSIFGSDRNTLGEVAGEKIAYDDYSKRVEQSEAQFKQQSGQANLNAQFTTYIQENVWNQKVSEIILNKEIEKLGLVVSSDEGSALVNGNNPDPQVVQYFGDPATGKVDQSKLNAFKAQLNASKPGSDVRVQWAQFIGQLTQNKLGQKYMNLVNTGLFVNDLDAKDDYEAKNKLSNFRYATLDYASIPDNKITLTDEDYKNYYDEHSSEFNNKQELRSFDYVSFNAAPSKEDTAAVKEQVEKLLPSFKASTNDSLFVQVNSETKTPILDKKKGQLGDPKLDTVMFGAQKGFVYGPYFSQGSYKLAKLIDSKTTFDSVKTRHILIKIGPGGAAKAMAKADSLKKLIVGGRPFKEIAATFSDDPGSAKDGGEIPSFDSNGLMGAGGKIADGYYKAAFKAKKGDLVIATSEFGVHLIQVEDQKGSSPVVKVAVVDKPVTPSAKTQQAAYAKAQAFLGSLTKDNFDAEAKKAGLVKKTAPDVNALTSALPGLDNAREVVRWAFKASKGDFGDQVYVIGDQYVIPTLTTIKPKGTSPLDAVKKQIEPAVRQHVKAKQLIEKLSGGSNIDQTAQKAGTKVVPVQNVVFANPVIPGLSLEYKVVGTVFGSQPGKLSKPIEGQHGVYVVVLDNLVNPAPLANAIRQREQIAQALAQRSQGQFFEALKDKANVKDYRSKFM